MGDRSLEPPLRFITAGEMEIEESGWGPHEWLCRRRERIGRVRAVVPD